MLQVFSTPDDPSRGIAQGVEEGLRRVAPGAGDTPASAVAYFGHGTTVATNALIQHRGVKTGLITTEGFRDLLEIGRQKRPELYDLYDAVVLLDLPAHGRRLDPAEIRAALGEYFEPDKEPRPHWIAPDEPWPPKDASEVPK